MKGLVTNKNTKKRKKQDNKDEASDKDPFVNSYLDV